MQKDQLTSSLHEDFRGEIRRYECDGVKFNVLTTKAGALRSGDVHPARQFDLILKGEFEITLRQDEQDVKIRKGANELMVIPPNIPHLFRAITDTVMIEWWDAPFEVEYYEPYRALIKQQFAERDPGT